MRVFIEYFAGARDLAGCDAEALEIPGAEIPIEALRRAIADRHPRLAPLLARMRMALNGEFAPGAPTLRDGDEVAVLPPVAGGSDDDGRLAARVALCEIWDRPLSVDAALDAVRRAGAGGIAAFIGVVRDEADGKAVARLDYESHPTLAPREMTRVLRGVAADFPGAYLSALHRTGQLAIGDAAVVIAASAPHRAEAFDACRAAIDRIKETVPIWKKEWDAGGHALWVNLESD